VPRQGGPEAARLLDEPELASHRSRKTPKRRNTHCGRYIATLAAADADALARLGTIPGVARRTAEVIAAARPVVWATVEVREIGPCWEGA
jgi:hypothetical protein